MLVALLGLLGALVLPVGLAAAAPDTVTPGSDIEAFAPYQGQTACEPIARPGVVAFRDLVLAAYPETGDSGIVRACHVGGTSEHKEGRAWDWRVDTSDPEDVEAVEDLFAWLMAEDEHGNAAAMMRRLGVMYVIWDSQVWKSYQAAKGWQPYSGASPHTDHVHFSYSWAGALKRTSYWTGEVSGTVASPILPPCPTASPSPSPSPSASTSTTTSTSPSSGPSASPSPSASPTPCTSASASSSASPSVSASASPSTSPSASPSASPSPSASVSPSPSTAATVLDTSVPADQRRAVVESLPGPWRRR